MNPHQLKRLFPNASKSVLAINACDYGDGIPVVTSVRSSTIAVLDGGTKLMSIVIKGQIRGGKNNMIVTKKGKHIPKKPWADWRDQAVRQVMNQLPSNWEPISTPTNVRIDYIAGDRKRRDFPAICDSIWHVLEKAGFVVDDTLLWPAQSSRGYDKESPFARITILT